MPNEQVKRNELILQYHSAHPEATLEEIGQMFHISKARVYQILKRDTPKTTRI
jgi:DNA-directed RNA polymerase sigma subunit (sigma70/sigma32)